MVQRPTAGMNPKVLCTYPPSSMRPGVDTAIRDTWVEGKFFQTYHTGEPAKKRIKTK